MSIAVNMVYPQNPLNYKRSCYWVFRAVRKEPWVDHKVALQRQKIPVMVKAIISNSIEPQGTWWAEVFRAG